MPLWHGVERRGAREKKLESRPDLYNAYRLTERLGYQHVRDFLRDQTSGELAGWLAYLRVDDEVQTQRTTIALMKAMKTGTIQQARQPVEEEKPIDTTDPNFVKHFKGFIVGDPPAQRRINRQANTEIKRG